jgi:large subunit ribosomal protein L23
MAHTISQVLDRPIITEKSTMMASKDKKFTFAIPNWATKDHVKEAFAKYFPDHKVIKVNIGKIFGKARRTRKGYTNPVDQKKAIITVDGAHIEYFPEI